MTQALRVPALLYPALFFFLLFLPDIFSFSGKESRRNAHIHRTTHDTYSRNSIFYLNAQKLRARFAVKGLSSVKYTTRCLLIGLSVGPTITTLPLSCCRPATVCILYELNCRYLELSCCLHHWSPQGPQQHCSLHTVSGISAGCINQPTTSSFQHLHPIRWQPIGQRSCSVACWLHVVYQRELA